MATGVTLEVILRTGRFGATFDAFLRHSAFQGRVWFQNKLVYEAHTNHQLVQACAKPYRNQMKCEKH
eukprot:2296736-Amphidinium_carterae.2